METRVFIGALAAVAGFAAIYAAVLVVVTASRRRGSLMAAEGDSPSVAGLVAWRLRNGFALLLPLADVLLENGVVRGFADGLAQALSHRGWSTGARETLTAVVACIAVGGIAAGVLTGSVIAAIACPSCAICALAVFVGNAADRCQEEVREAVPDALESMASCFGSGFTLLQTFRQVAEDTPGALGETFANCAHVLEMGGSAREALKGLREGAHASELAFVAVALDVQHQTGGALRQVLDAATDTVKGELALRRSLRVQTAQAKLSARVVVVMPFILVAAFSLASPDFLSPFFSSPAGYALLALAVIMQVAGIMLVRRALAVDGVV